MIRASVGVCSECLSPYGADLNVAGCAECASDDPLEIDLVVTGPGGYTPERPGRRTMDRFPEPDEPAEWDHICMVTRADTGEEIAYDDLPCPTQEVIDDTMRERTRCATGRVTERVGDEPHDDPVGRHQGSRCGG